jgi:tetratricopeptide (TPR) repeat protein
MQGEWDTGLAMCQRSLDRSPDPVNTALALAFLGTAHLEKQDAVQAIPLLEQAVQRFSQFQFQQGEGRCMPLLGEALLLDGRHEQAQRWARQGLDISREAKYLYGVGLAHRALGRIAQANGDHTEAAHHLSAALQTFGCVPPFTHPAA